MEYAEFPPLPSLAADLVCTWVDMPRLVRQPVMPDACIDLVWDGTSVWVAGPDTRAWPVTGHQTFVGIRFRPGAAPRFLGVAASELLDRQVPLSDLWSRTASEFAEQLTGGPSEVIATLQQALLNRRDAVRDEDPVVEEVVYELSRHESHRTSVLDLADKLDVSERTLRRRCTDALGYGPKTLDRILRFRRALRLVRDGHPLAETAQVAGYADQAHMANEFRRFSDASPSAIAAAPGLTLAANGYD